MYILTNGKFDEPIFGTGLYTPGLIFRRKNTSICNLLKVLPFFLFSSIKLVFWHISHHWRYEICSKLIIKTPEYVTVTIKLTIKTPWSGSGLFIMTLNTFHLFLQCFYCWLWSVNCRLGLLLVVLTLFACWNQFRQIFNLWIH